MLLLDRLLLVGGQGKQMSLGDGTLSKGKNLYCEVCNTTLLYRTQSVRIRVAQMTRRQRPRKTSEWIAVNECY